ncbi:MAG: glycosyl transferase [Geminicoccaceae bacterium]
MIYAFTSAALNYLPKARLCLGSLRRFHPEFRLVYALADRLPDGMELREDCVDEVIPVETLPGIGRPGWIFQHSIVELSTGIKGAVLQRLLARPDCEAVLYFDPDIVLFSRLDDLVERLLAADIVLTPHQARPEATLERIVDNEIGSLKWGIFNLGFIGVRNGPTGSTFADWWAHRLQHFCFDRLEQGLFTDQKWINHVPVFFDGVEILKESRFNVATWNITTRELTGDAPDGVLVDGRPLGFYHFTGFDSGAHAVMAERNGAGNRTLEELVGWYERASRAADDDALARMPWAFARYADGTSIEPGQRRVYGMRAGLQRTFPDPFGAAPGPRAMDGCNSFADWARTRGVIEYPQLCGDAITRADILATENARLREELRLLKGSLSWKITKPLRVMS